MSGNVQKQQRNGARAAKMRVGTVTSNKMTKTVVVQVERRMKHGRYGKYMTEKRSTRRTTRSRPARSATSCASPRPGPCQGQALAGLRDRDARRRVDGALAERS